MYCWWNKYLSLIIWRKIINNNMLRIPIKSKTPSQVLFNLFLIPTALPMTFSSWMAFSIMNSTTIVLPIGVGNITHFPFCQTTTGGREKERDCWNRRWKWERMAEEYKEGRGREIEKGYDLGWVGVRVGKSNEVGVLKSS